MGIGEIILVSFCVVMIAGGIIFAQIVSKKSQASDMTGSDKNVKKGKG